MLAAARGRGGTFLVMSACIMRGPKQCHYVLISFVILPPSSAVRTYACQHMACSVCAAAARNGPVGLPIHGIRVLVTCI